MGINRLASEMWGGWLGKVPLFCPTFGDVGGTHNSLMALTLWLMATLFSTFLFSF